MECPPGSVADSLVNACIPKSIVQKSQQPVTDTLAVLRTGAPSESLSTVGPGVWIGVGAVLGSSVLAFLLWFIIYKHNVHKTGKRGSGTTASLQHNGDAHARASLEETEVSSTSCPHVNGKVQEVSICELGWGRGVCNGGVEHGVPLPATELGDSALVTTKTVQTMEV